MTPCTFFLSVVFGNVVCNKYLYHIRLHKRLCVGSSAPFYTETGASLRDTEDRGKEVEPTQGQ